MEAGSNANGKLYCVFGKAWTIWTSLQSTKTEKWTFSKRRYLEQLDPARDASHVFGWDHSAIPVASCTGATTPITFAQAKYATAATPTFGKPERQRFIRLIDRILAGDNGSGPSKSFR